MQVDYVRVYAYNETAALNQFFAHRKQNNYPADLVNPQTFEPIIVY